MSHVDRREVEEYSHRQVYPVRRTRDAGSKHRHQSAVGCVGEQTPEKRVSSEEGKKEHLYLLKRIYRSLASRVGDPSAPVQKFEEISQLLNHLRRGSSLFRRSPGDICGRRRNSSGKHCQIPAHLIQNHRTPTDEGSNRVPHADTHR